ncbi:LYR motif-containing protein 4 isoform X1 [Prionailurus viverrinus]|uniref:LYR motif-containing protein 4 isoform X1 n=2 Tax=Prionailurus TaxID=37028 RepID=UPI001CA9F2E9|nr:LYR motif-containing protein 4 isoform X1 [Prionailurus bengalensis]XP_047716681.1 LYR motif-containing protein 4 isoform X1 [Prionailurus viverrinus]
MAASSRAQVLDLYRAMLRESKHFSAYNYRTYAVRRIRDAFRENKNVKDPVEIQTLVNKAKRDLEIIRRQVMSLKSTPAVGMVGRTHIPRTGTALRNLYLPGSSSQVHIGQLYSTDKLIIENQEKPRT